MSFGTRFRGVGSPLFVGTVLGIFFKDFLSGGTVPLYGDLAFFVLPMKHFLAEQIRLGEIPLWNPWVYMGTPFLAGLQTGVFYPPSLLLALPFPLGFDLFLVGHYLIALGGAWALLRDRSLSYSACAVGSLTFALGGYLVSMMSETNHLQAAVWAPWVLLYWMRYRRWNRLADLALFVVVLSVELLGGSPETLLMTLATAVGWTAWKSFRCPKEALRLSIALSVALVLVFLITALQILPTGEYVAESDRSGSLSFAEVSAWSLEPISLLQLVLPRTVPIGHSGGDAFPLGFETYAPWIRSLYLGAIPLCLAFAGVASGRDRAFWGLLAAFGIVLALGRHTPALAFLFNIAPQIFGRFRYPEKAYFLVHLAAVILAAEGAELLIRRGPRGTRTACWAGAGLMAFALLVLGAHRWESVSLPNLVAAARGSQSSPESTAALVNQMVYLSSRLTGITGIFLGLTLLRGRGLIAPARFNGLLVLAVATDLCSAHYGLLSTASWSKLFEQPLVVEPSRLNADRRRIFHYQTSSPSFPGEQPQPISGLAELDRVTPSSDSPRALWFDTWRILFADIGMVYGVGNVSGGDGIGRRSNAMLLQALSSVSRDEAVRLLRLYSVGWLIGSAPLDVRDLERVSPSSPSRYFVYRVADPIPEARLVSTLELVGSDDQALRRLLAADFPVESAAVVDRLPPYWSNRRGSDRDAASVQVVSYDCDRVAIDVETDQSSFLVLNDSHFPGWEARTDDSPTEIFRTNLFVRGIAVPSGHHRVEFRYRPVSFRRGVVLSALGLLGLNSLAIAGARQDRRRKAASRVAPVQRTGSR